MANRKKKFPLYVAFGTAARNWAEENEELFLSLKRKKHFFEDGGYATVIRFKTAGERSAYCRGLDDNDGWMAYYCSDGTPTPEFKIAP